MKSNLEIAKEVISGLWGNGEARIRNLTNSGYDATAIQYLVNKILSGDTVSDSAETQGNFLEVEVDLSKVNGITLIFKGY